MPYLRKAMVSNFEILLLNQTDCVYLTWQFGNCLGCIIIEINDAVWRLVAYGLILKRRHCAHASNACAQSSRNNLLVWFECPLGTWSGIVVISGNAWKEDVD